MRDEKKHPEAIRWTPFPLRYGKVETSDEWAHKAVQEWLDNFHYGLESGKHNHAAIACGILPGNG